MLRHESTKPREAEHLTSKVMSLYQPVTVKQYCLAGSQNDLLIAPPRHEPQGLHKQERHLAKRRDSTCSTSSSNSL